MSLLSLDKLRTVLEVEGGAEYLKRHIYFLAISGKLSMQQKRYLPAEKLLEEIVSQLYKKSKHVIQHGEVHSNTNLPTGWTWAKTSDIGTFTSGGTPSMSNPEYWNGTIPWVSPKDMKTDDILGSEMYITQKGADNSKAKLLPENTLIFVVRSGILKRTIPVSITKVPATINQDLKAWILVKPEMAEFLRICIKGMEKQLLSTVIKKGMTVESFDFEVFKNFLIPLPPLQEQKVIVENVNTILTVLADLDLEIKKKKDIHSQIVLHSHYALETAVGPKELKDSWGFLKNNFSEVYNNLESVDELRSAVLSLAIRGNLTTQEENDTPAKITLKKVLNTMPSKDSGPFQIPKSWEWITLGDISETIQYGATASASEDGVYKLLRITDIQNRSVNWATVPYSNLPDKENVRYLLKENDIVIARTGGTVGKSFRVKDPPKNAVFASYLIKLQIFKGAISLEYLDLFLDSPLYWLSIKGGARGAAQPNVNTKALSSIPIPLAPIEEQLRIVKRVNELFQWINELRTMIAEKEKLLELSMLQILDQEL